MGFQLGRTRKGLRLLEHESRSEYYVIELIRFLTVS
jgi:hypothetical protein